MIHQINILTGLDKVETAIKRYQTFEPPEGYYLAFSGGKDSVVIKALADMAGVKYHAVYRVTSVDPPELVWFIKEHHPDVKFDYPRDKDGKVITMWNLIPRAGMPPTRVARYCCDHLKESGGQGEFTVTGIRWAESAKRKATRAGLELNFGKGKKSRNATGGIELTDPDNPDNEELARYCPTKGKHILNPIIDWTTEEVWEFIHEYKIPYCCLYDEGFKRLGCIGCPMGSIEQRNRDLERYPKIKEAYLRAFDRMLQNYDGRIADTAGGGTTRMALALSGQTQARSTIGGSKCDPTAEEVMEWWIR